MKNNIYRIKKLLFHKSIIRGLIGGIILSIGALIYILAIDSLPNVVNPSSTESLKYIAYFIILIVAGGIGTILGIWFGKLIETKFPKLIKFIPIILLIALSLLTTIVGSILFIVEKKQLTVWNKDNTIGIQIDKGIVKRIAITPDHKLHNYNLSLNANHSIGHNHGNYVNSSYNLTDNEVNEFNWNGKRYIASMDGISLMGENKYITNHSHLSNHPYIIGMSYLTYPVDTNKSFLFLLIRFRATSHLSALFVYDANGELVYKELMNHSENMLETGEINDSKKVIILGRSTRKDDVYERSLGDHFYSIDPSLLK